MFRRRNSSSTRDGSVRRFRNRSRIHAFLVISLAVFLIAMALARQPDHVTAQAALLHQADSIVHRDDGIATVSMTPGSQTVIERLKSDAFRQKLTPNPANSNNRATPGDRREQVTQTLDAHLAANPSQPGNTIELALSAASEEEAVALLTCIIDQIVDERNSETTAEAFMARWTKARDAVTQANQRRERARQVSDDYLERELERRRHDQAAAEATAQSASAAAGSPAGVGSNLPKIEIPNPYWQDLDESLTAAGASLAELLKTRTSAHPLVLRQEREIRNLRETLATTPRFRPQDEDPSAGAIPSTTSGELANDSEESVVAPFDDETELAQIRQTTDYRQFESDYQLAEETYLLQSTRFHALPDPTQMGFERLAVSRPARVVDTRAVVVTPRNVLNYSAIAVLTGMALTLLCRFQRLPDRFYSAKDVGSTLGLPVTATMSIENGPAVPAPPERRLPRVTRWAVAASELFVVATVLLLLLNCFLRPTFGPSLLQDPFASYLDAIDNASRFLPRSSL